MGFHAAQARIVVVIPFQNQKTIRRLAITKPALGTGLGSTQFDAFSGLRGAIFLGMASKGYCFSSRYTTCVIACYDGRAIILSLYKSPRVASTSFFIATNSL
jgi:hypothetical protein